MIDNLPNIDKTNLLLFLTGLAIFLTANNVYKASVFIIRNFDTIASRMIILSRKETKFQTAERRNVIHSLCFQIICE